MTSSNGNISRVTGPLCGEVTGEFPSQRPVTRSFVVFFDLDLNKRLSEVGDLRRHRAHYDVTVMSFTCLRVIVWKSTLFLSHCPTKKLAWLDWLIKGEPILDIALINLLVSFPNAIDNSLKHSMRGSWWRTIVPFGIRFLSVLICFRGLMKYISGLLFISKYRLIYAIS